MSSNSVYQSLLELFPQVDLRILRALSIEHANDINGAVEFILSEVMPVASAATDFSDTHGTYGLEQSSREEVAKASEHNVLDNQPLLPLVMPHDGESKSSALYPSVTEEQRSCDVLFQDQLISVCSNPISASTCQTSGHDNELSLYINYSSGKEDECLSYEASNQNDLSKLLLNEGSAKIFQTEQCSDTSDGSHFENMGLPTTAQEVYQVVDKQSSQVDVETVASIFDVKNKSLMECVSEKEYASQSLILLEMDIPIETPVTPTCIDSLPGDGDKDRICGDSRNEEHKDALYYENDKSFTTDENSTELSSSKNKDYNNLPTSLATRSGHFVSTELLEGSINDVRNGKKTLLSSMGSIFSLMQEVEFAEEKAKQASQEAFVAGHDTFSKVEETKQIVRQTMDDNDVHAGEVYGERSILATEARELHSRLLRMSEERSEYVSVTEEIFRALEGRLASAKEEIAAANLEKLEKEERALKALQEQELVRDAILAESKKLQEEAEENSKLRELLMDRGRLVDSLQGEIAIVCEDILALKQRVDARLPLTKSLCSSTWSFASTTGSPDHREHSSSSTNQECLKEHREAENVIQFCSKPSLEDWEFFE